VWSFVAGVHQLDLSPKNLKALQVVKEAMMGAIVSDLSETAHSWFEGKGTSKAQTNFDWTRFLISQKTSTQSDM
jgi:hypothetical protein